MIFGSCLPGLFYMLLKYMIVKYKVEFGRLFDRSSGLEFRILCLEGNVISFITLSKRGSYSVHKSGLKPHSFHLDEYKVLHTLHEYDTVSKLRGYIGITHHSKHETSTHCWFNAGPSFATLDQHYINKCQRLVFTGVPFLWKCMRILLYHFCVWYHCCRNA